MSALSYIAVILIWSTTPLAIKLSSTSVSPIAAASLRMALALVFAVLIFAALRRHSYWDKRNVKTYFAASLGIFPNMPLVYWATQYISSGLVAVIFALSPFVMCVAAYFLLGQNVLTLRKCIGLLLGIIGLVVIFIDQVSISDGAMIGIGLMMISNLVYSISSIWVKRLNQQRKIDAFDQTIGALAFSIPGLLFTWYVYDGFSLPALDATVVGAIVYLALLGSLVGFAAFYYVLNHFNVSTVAIIPMITPALALWWGAVIADELVTLYTMVGSGLIILGLILYESMFKPGIISKMRPRLRWVAED